MITNADITIYNRRYEKADRTEKFVATRIRGVSFYTRKGVTSGGQSLSGENTHTIRIPVDADMEEKTYVPQKEYEAMDDEKAAGYWTLQPGAIIVRGISDLETATETELKERFQDVVLVTDFTDNRDRCTEQNRHWRIGGE